MLACLCVLLAATGCDSESVRVTRMHGSYETTVPASAGVFAGKWSIRFAGGSDTVVHDGASFVTERLEFDGPLVTFRGDPGPHACPGPGRYRWALSGDRLTFVRVGDHCPGRRAVLSRTLTRQR